MMEDKETTERRVLREALLQESEQRHREYISHSPYGIFVADGQGCYQQVNPAACRMTGYSEQELLALNIDDMLAEESLEEGRRLFEQLLAQGEIQAEILHRLKNGEKRWMSLTAVKITEDRLIGFCNDITDRKRAEQNYQNLFQKMLDGFALHEIVYNDAGIPHDYRFLAVNPAFEQMTGLRAADIVGRTVHEVLPGIESHWIDSYGRVVITGEPAFFESSSGDLKKYFQVTAYRPAANQFACIFADISERKRDEEERKKLQEQLQQAQKMEAIGTLAGGIAHDFNNILGAILGYAEMAHEDCASGLVKPRDLEQILKAGNRAKELVKQILAFSRQAEEQKITLQPAVIIKESIKLLRSSIPSTIDIQQDVDPAVHLIHADPIQLHQIIMNLCTNAYHAMEETGGRLVLSLKNRVVTKEDVLGLPHVQSGDFVQLSIGDTGAGIAPEIRQRIFEPYFTTKETGKGTGMGLAIVHGIVNSSGGFITCDSEVGAGTVFTINLPALVDPEIPVTSKIELVPVGTERILLIDDELMLAEMGRTMLERLGYTVTICTESLVALAVFKKEPDAFDLVITDQTMPEMTGIDIARRMLQLRPELPIVLCTGYSSIISEQKAKSSGIKGFVLKPLVKKDLAALIRQVLDKEPMQS